MEAVKIPDFDSFEQANLALWAEVKSGNRASFARLYENHVEILHNYGRRICEKSGIVEDSVQDTFIDIWLHRENIIIQKSLKFYLLKSLKRKIFQKLKQDNRYVYSSGQDDVLPDGHVLSRQQEIIADQDMGDHKKKLRHALDGLTKRQQEVIYLRYYHNFSNDEVSEIMEISIDAVYNLASKAIARLKQTLLHLSCFLFIYKALVQ